MASGAGDVAGASLAGVSVTVRLPREVGNRLVAEAARRGMSADDLAVELVTAGVSGGDALEALIGSLHSGRGDLGRRHRAIRAEAS